jgi:methylmalonyl-CoA mutase N-terminal domain/subunit
MVGVNEFINEEEKIEIDILKIDPQIEKDQAARVQKLRSDRDNLRTGDALDALRKAATGTENLIPYILECVRAYATEGELIQVMREVFGEFKEKPIF